MWLYILNCSDHRLILRGCSSKRKMFHIECESHMSGTRCICHFCHISNTRKLVTQTQTVSWHHIYSFLFGSTINNTDMLLTSRKEQFCYCSYDLCNEGSSGRIKASTLLGLALPLLLIVNIRWHRMTTAQSNRTTRIFKNNIATLSRKVEIEFPVRLVQLCLSEGQKLIFYSYFAILTN